MAPPRVKKTLPMCLTGVSLAFALGATSLACRLGDWASTVLGAPASAGRFRTAVELALLCLALSARTSPGMALRILSAVQYSAPPVSTTVWLLTPDVSVGALPGDGAALAAPAALSASSAAAERLRRLVARVLGVLMGVLTGGKRGGRRWWPL